LAFEAAARCVKSGGILLTADADACVYPNWIEANLAELRKGVDAVAGRIEIDPVDAALIPSKLHEDDARECAYAALLDEINARLDPNAFDLWPSHSEHSGASIAVTADAYRRAGGIPAVALGKTAPSVMPSGASMLASGIRPKRASLFRGEFWGVRSAAWRIRSAAE
jgi:hypothetical protein